MIEKPTHTSRTVLVHLMVRIFVYLSPDDQIRFIGKSGIPTQNVLAVCDFNMRFTYVSTGQPGAMHDTRYPNRPGYLAPHKGERYHMLEWHRGMEPKTPREKFNRVHSSI
ncbi:hypothetical protein U9M48_027130 [Paspalum notatum var. saurae]|uniref:Uncharacterized protein n=1 Tax=Paspalum notatum var. saurae TaxID=547442 RepID=A0AAQ3TY56_PASNO